MHITPPVSISGSPATALKPYLAAAAIVAASAAFPAYAQTAPETLQQAQEAPRQATAPGADGPSFTTGKAAPSRSDNSQKAQHFFMTGDGVRIAYRIDGPLDKPALVLSNSIATTMDMWDTQIPELSRHFRVIRYDTRGHGASGVPAGAYSFDRLGRDVVELLDALKIEKAHFLGLSLGGLIGQWLGIHAPERIDRLILSNTSSYLGPADQWDKLIASLLQEKTMSEMADMFMSNWFPRHMLEQQDPRVVPFRAMVLATDKQGLAGAFAAVRDADMRRTVTLIERPTLVIAGRDDTVTLASHGELIAAAVKNSRLVTLPAVHMPNIEKPAEFLKAVLEFLG